jgi:hypothetical protein
MIVSQNELINFMCFLSFRRKKLIKMVSLVFRGNKSENPKYFWRNIKEFVLVLGLKQL